jgi:hypothetical protein
MRRTPCRQPGCSQLVVGSGYCDRHKQNNARTNDRVNKLYDLHPWSGVNGIATVVKAKNPLCQKLIREGGRLIRCRHFSYLVHHRLSPRQRPDLFLSVYDENGVSQLIALCADCHPNSEGTPDWKEGVEGPVPPGGGEFFIRTEFSITI